MFHFLLVSCVQIDDLESEKKEIEDSYIDSQAQVSCINNRDPGPVYCAFDEASFCCCRR